MKIISFHVPTQGRLERKRMHQFTCILPTNATSSNMQVSSGEL